MNCPVCSHHSLQHIQINGIQLDVCTNGCLGIWFDQFELKKFDEPHESLDGKVETATSSSRPTTRNHQIHCPKCKDIVMLKRFTSINKKVEIDECPKCAGIWFDAGELSQFRNEFKTVEERRKAADKLFDEMFGESLKTLKKESLEQQKTRRIAHAFRYLSPSFYIPGKQKWGAF
jgi:uncharacterized protein